MRSEPARFFLIFALTLLVTRIFLSLYHLESPVIWGFQLHHYMYGILGTITALATGSVALFAVSFALIIDEVTWFILGTHTFDAYLTLPSLLGTAALTGVVYFFRKRLLDVLAFTSK